MACEQTCNTAFASDANKKAGCLAYCSMLESDAAGSVLRIDPIDKVYEYAMYQNYKQRVLPGTIGANITGDSSETFCYTHGGYHLSQGSHDGCGNVGNGFYNAMYLETGGHEDFCCGMLNMDKCPKTSFGAQPSATAPQYAPYYYNPLSPVQKAPPSWAVLGSTYSPMKIQYSAHMFWKPSSLAQADAMRTQIGLTGSSDYDPARLLRCAYTPNDFGSMGELQAMLKTPMLIGDPSNPNYADGDPAIDRPANSDRGTQMGYSDFAEPPLSIQQSACAILTTEACPAGMPVCPRAKPGSSDCDANIVDYSLMGRMNGALCSHVDQPGCLVRDVWRVPVDGDPNVKFVSARIVEIPDGRMTGDMNETLRYIEDSIEAYNAATCPSPLTYQYQILNVRKDSSDPDSRRIFVSIIGACANPAGYTPPPYEMSYKPGQFAKCDKPGYRVTGSRVDGTNMFLECSYGGPPITPPLQTTDTWRAIATAVQAASGTVSEDARWAGELDSACDASNGAEASSLVTCCESGPNAKGYIRKTSATDSRDVVEGLAALCAFQRSGVTTDATGTSCPSQESLVGLIDKFVDCDVILRSNTTPT